jgi:Zn-dependent protease with chaperone function
LLLQWFLISGVFYGFGFGRLNQDAWFYVGLFGIVALIGASLTVWPILKGIPHVKTSVFGLHLDEGEYPTVWRFIRDLAAKAGAKPPDHLVVGFTPNFFVTEAEVNCVSGNLVGATMYLSLPLCRILSVGELSAVVLHELAHFKGEDAAFTIHFYPIYKGVSDSLYGVSNASAKIANVGSYIPIAGFKLIFAMAALFLLPSVYLLRFFFDSFSRAENHIGRDREIAADALAAQIQGPSSIASVLVKLAGFAPVWNDLAAWARTAQSEGVVVLGEKTFEPRAFFYNMSDVFQLLAEDSATPDRLQGLDLSQLFHPTDTHPPLSIRLRALNISMESIQPLALSVTSEEPSSSLIDNVEDLEIKLSELQLARSAA